ncbi:MAG: hypothetical protein V7688_08255 [Alcanivorax jadensis]|uniref:hypothetical protein n=1 Tax=Alcanivorax jadensis TaxID=64988 RepID=UPI0030023231
MKVETPKVVTFQGSTPFKGVPEVTDVEYDLYILRLTLKFESLDGPVYVEFDGVKGFRVLDEGDLLEFWDERVRADGWLWNVQEGGWQDLERNREGFLSRPDEGYKEYLICGVDDCVSILSFGPPLIRRPKP